MKTTTKKDQRNPQAFQILAEELAFHDLRRQGYKILLRNYECVKGEIQIIAKEGGYLVFVMVNANPAEMADALATAAYYLRRYGIQDVQTRFDIVRVDFAEGKEPVIRSMKGAF